MKMNWTTEQSNAIRIPVSDTIVSAAAGSGKTAVMAERIITRLTGDNPVDIDRILVVTYTNAAASEIKERVMQKIVDKLKESNDDFLQRQLILINNAHFCTIHSFCLELIKKYFYILGIDPSPKTGDPGELSVLLSDSALDVINTYLNEKDQSFAKLMNAYADGKEAKLQKMILDVYNMAMTMPDSDAFLDSLPELYRDSAKAQSAICSCSSMYLNYILGEYDSMISILDMAPSCEKLRPLLESERTMVMNALSVCDDYRRLYNSVYNIHFERFTTVKPSPEDAALKDRIKKLRDNAKSVFDKQIKKYHLAIASEYIDSDCKCVYPYVLKLTEAVRRTAEAYSNVKKENNLIDFSDYEHMALHLLKNPDGTPTDIAYAVSDSFEEIYIDEYQDCNNIQNTIFSLISGSLRGKPNMFCVGDMKQSIYKFRDANPLNFKKRCDISQIYNGADVNDSNKIFLNANFRSRPSVLKFANSVFYQIMSDEMGELEYDENEALNPGAVFDDSNPDIGYIDIDIISSTDDFGDGCYPSDTHLSKEDAEVTHIAQKIRSYIDSGYLLYDRKTGESRKAEYKDIVILMRGPKSYTEMFERIFSYYKIPLYCDNGAGFFRAEEIRFLLSFLKIIDNPDDDIALAAVLKNVIFAFDENMLLKIRMYTGKGTYYDCIKAYIDKYTDDISQRLESFIQIIEALYMKSRYMSTDELLSCLVNEIDYFVYLSSFSDSKLRKANVYSLIHKAKEFESDCYKGIYSFVNYMDNLKESNSVKSAKSLGADDNVVRLMSIHKSKGLEFPIVFLSGLGKEYNLRDGRSPYVIHKDLGLGLSCVHLDKSYTHTTVNKQAIKYKLKSEALSEEMRVLYVALTRPVEKLICTAVIKNAADTLNKIEHSLINQPYKISPYLLYSSDMFIKTILLASMRSSGFESASGTVFDTPVSDGVKYNLTLKNISDVIRDSGPEQSLTMDEAYDSPTDKYNDMADNFSFIYPHVSSGKIPGNITVTEIKRLHQNEDENRLYRDVSLIKPSYFGASRPITGSAFGSLMHLCMEKMDLRNLYDDKSVGEELNKLFLSGLINDSELNALNTRDFVDFYNSGLCKAMIHNYSSLRREYAFKYMLPASLVYDVESNDEMVVQGTIDAFYEDTDGQIVLIDYKTDKVPTEGADEIGRRYMIQLSSYAGALEKMLDKKVKQRLIYLFDTGETITL